MSLDAPAAPGLPHVKQHGLSFISVQDSTEDILRGDIGQIQIMYIRWEGVLLVLGHLLIYITRYAVIQI